MRRASARTLLAGVLLAGLGLPAAEAAGPGADSGAGLGTAPEDAPRTVTLRARCAGGSGAIVLRHTTEAGATRVSIVGTGLRDGRWDGEHLLEVGVDDTHDTRLRLRAVGGELHHEIDVADSGPAGVLHLRGAGGRRCSAAFDENRPWVILTSAQDSVVVRHPGPRLFTVNGQVECRRGSEWSVMVSVEARGSGAATGAAPVRCGRPGFLRFRWQDRWESPAPKPTAVTYVGRNLDTGAVRRVSYRATSPSPWNQSS